MSEQSLISRPEPFTVEVVNPDEDARRRTVSALPAFDGEIRHLPTPEDYLKGNPAPTEYRKL